MHIMSNDKSTRRRVRSAQVTTTISIALVLFLVGMIGLLVLNAGRVSDYVKENLSLTVIFTPDAREAEVRQIEKQLLATAEVKSVRFIDKEAAARQMEESLGEDFVRTLGYNPLLPSMEVKLHADYATEQGMGAVADMLRAYKHVREVNYEQDVVNLIHTNIRRISLVLLAFSLLMLLVSVTLIHNTVRLMVYGRRFLIRTMQLVGATRSFIRRPFLGSAALQGLLGGLIANALLAGVVYLSSTELPGVIGFGNVASLALLFTLVFALGAALTTLSTANAVNRYLSIRTADLYV